MLTEDQAILIQASEECCEVQHRISKALRFGLDEVQSGQSASNRERIEAEIVDLVCLLELMQKRGIITLPIPEVPYDLTKSKREKLRRYLAYSKELGIVS